MKHLLILIAFFVSQIGYSFEYETIKLDSSVVIPLLPDSVTNSYPAVIIDEDFVQEYAYMGNEMVVFQTIRKQVLAVDDRGVEAFNRIYIPFGQSLELVDIKVRSVSPSGKVTNFNKQNIKEVKNLDDAGAYRIFAVEGIEKMGLVEILYTLRNVVTSYGRHTIQQEVPVLKSRFMLVTPTNIYFETRGYNHSFAYSDTVVGLQSRTTYTARDMPGLKKEKYSAHNANLARVEYSFSYNSSAGSRVTNTWNEAAKVLHESFYAPNVKMEKKILKIIKSMKLDKLNEMQKVRAIENYIKDHFQLKAYNNIDNIATLENSLKNKYTNEQGFTLLFCTFMRLAGINHQLGCTSNRFDSRFDRNFVTWNYLYEYVIYFPGIDKYLSPTAVQYRLGIVPQTILNNNALFLKFVTIDDHTSVLGDVRFIPQCNHELNITRQTAKVEIDADQGLAKINYRHELGGYEANYIKPYYDFIEESKRDEVVQQMLKLMGKDTRVLGYRLENTSHNESPLDSPFVVEGSLEVKSLVEKAGENLVFNVGDMIGEQVEMYQDHKRQLPVELDYGHCYHRVIELTIPAGYALKGSESLAIDKQFGDGQMGFVSSYKIADGKLLVDIREYYRDISIPVELFADFRTVINAAADFNKVSVVFEKNNP